MGVQSQCQLFALFVSALRNRPFVGEQVVPVYIWAILDDVSLTADKEKIAKVGRKGVIAEGGWRSGLGARLNEAPSCWLIVEAAGVKLPQDACFCAESAVKIDVTCLDAGCEVGSRRKVVPELQLHPTSVDFLAIGRGKSQLHLRDLQYVWVLHRKLIIITIAP